MARAKADPENQSIRVNISVTEECVAQIDELIEASHVFNSRADFIHAALRSMCFKYVSVATATLAKAKERCGDTPAAMEDFVSSMNAMGQALEGRYRDRFGKALAPQIAIRMKPRFYNELVGMDALSPMGIQPLARMAIVDYCQEIESEILIANKVFEETGKLSKSGPSEEDILGSIALWDEITSRSG